MPRTTILCCGQESVSISVFLAAMEALVDYGTLHRHSVPFSRSSSSPQAGISGQPQSELVDTCFYDSNNLDQRKHQCANVLALAIASRSNVGQDHLPGLLEKFKNSFAQTSMTMSTLFEA